MAFREFLCILFSLLVLLVIWRCFIPPRRMAPLSPGPKGKPFIGNLLDLPPTGNQAWKHWLEHKARYGKSFLLNFEIFRSSISLMPQGPLSSITVFGGTIVIINERELAFQIVEKNSLKHSSRPRLVFADELCVFSY